MMGVLYIQQTCRSCYVAILFKIHFTQLMGSCFVVGLLLFGTYEALYRVTLHKVTLHKVTLHKVTLHKVTLHKVTLPFYSVH